jgi:hypothetical protein
MGVEKAGVDANVEFPAYLTKYVNVEKIKQIKDENAPAASAFFHTSK